jgi:two-component sensor histidine kinase
VNHAVPEDLWVELSIRPTWSVLPLVRHFVEQSLSSFIDDGDLAYRLSMATHELFENAIKYATSPTATVRVSACGSVERVWISLSNDSDPEHIADLRQQFAEMAAAADPMVYYCDMMRRYWQQTDVSRLGLARIQAEGLRLSLSAEGSGVTIRAEPRLAAPGAAG